MRWPFGPPHLTLKPSKIKKQKNKTKQKQNKNKKTNKKGQRWPFGPPHMTLKPSKKNKKKQNQKKKNKKKKQKKTRKNQKYSKMSFSVISENFLFFWLGVQNFPFFTTWPKKRAHKKHYKNRGFRPPFFGKQLCVTKRPFLDQKNQNL